MPTEFIRVTFNNPSTEIDPIPNAKIDPEFLVGYARSLDDYGFNYTLVPYDSASYDPFSIGATIAANTKNIKIIIALRPNTIYPTVAAKALATLDQLSKGRVVVHFIAGGSDDEQAKEGDFLNKEERYERLEEYIRILRLAWTSAEPFDFDGRYYQFKQFVSHVPPTNGTIPVSIGGSSDAAYRIGGTLADIFGLWGEPLKETKEQIERIHAEAKRAGRTDYPRIWVTFRPIVAETDELAWTKAHAILDALKKNRAKGLGKAQATSHRWPEALYHSTLEDARTRPVLLNAARVEPELGSPARGGLPSTLARRTAHGWSISGRKRFVTGADGLTHFLVWARTDEAPTRVGTFVVASEKPGISIIHNWNSLGMRASGSHDVEFADVEVPLDHGLDLTDVSVAQQDNRGHAAITLAVTAIYLGVAEAAQAAFARFAHARVPSNLGHPIAQTERFITTAGEIDLAVGGARQIIFDALNPHVETPEALMRARLLAGRQIRDAVQLAVRALGNPGLSAELGLERHFRDIQAVLVHAPQEDTASSILGGAAFRHWKAGQDHHPCQSTNASLSLLKAV